jgi:uncharacterized membrane protein
MVQGPRPDAQGATAALIQTYEGSFHSGPLPDPASLQHYESISPGMAERILRMAEGEQAHRHTQDAKRLQAEISAQQTALATNDARIRGIFASDRRGQWLGYSICLCALAGAIISLWLNAYWAITVAFLGLPVLGMVKALRSSPGIKHPTDIATK